MRLTKFLKRILVNRDGATAIEYGLIVALIVIALIVSLESVANENTGVWAIVTQKVTTVL